ncbi:hypothetical protein CDCA_CDCA11G3241 [Cyanidium caldarium]|uniref:Xylulose kinase n=1 Tax=Cyanidium caldarium TaxID=2771 RepID=A0AAV9IYI8_CYACA|nr:hypothetical protein CDCA_CDCA11G3241 [Cyanidium caldarium]|eukprot:ctg_2089.g557
MGAEDALYLGLDLSTQSLDAVAVDIRRPLENIWELTVEFDRDLPQFHTHRGHHRDERTGAATAPTFMFVAALDLLLERLRQNSFPFGRVRAVAVAAQQHGSVYWQRVLRLDRDDVFADPRKSLQELLRAPVNSFSVLDGPIWADASTTRQCRQLEAEFPGGAAGLALVTGSRAYERYTAAQVIRLAQERPDAFQCTRRIQVLSAFMTSLLAGRFCDEDVADASGTQWMDIRTVSPRWHPQSLLATERAAGVARAAVRDRLALQPVLTNTVAADHLAPYYCHRYGFSRTDCCVVTGTGDNPSSAAGLALQLGDLCVSLGTSDTAFGRCANATPQLEAHVFRSPLDRYAFLPILVFANGSLLREAVRGADATWEDFEACLQRTPPGNHGVLGIYARVDEILPRLPAGTVQLVRAEPVSSSEEDKAASQKKRRPLPPPRLLPYDQAAAPPHDVLVRAVVEQRALAIAHHGRKIGLQIPPRQILVTGGASQSPGIRQVLADTLGAPVAVLDTDGSDASGAGNSAVRGAAFRAAYVALRRDAAGDSSVIGDDMSAWMRAIGAVRYRVVATPDPAAHAYLRDVMVPAYGELEKSLQESIAATTDAKSVTRSDG